MTTFDLSSTTLREVNAALHAADSGSFTITNPRGAHALAAGIDAPVDVEIDGPVGYYCAGMHKTGTVLVKGNASTGLAENIMSGTVRITGNAMMSAGATGCGGLLVISMLAPPASAYAWQLNSRIFFPKMLAALVSASVAIHQ